jgi:hypothetical protein
MNEIEIFLNYTNEIVSLAEVSTWRGFNIYKIEIAIAVTYLEVKCSQFEIVSEHSLY